MARSRRKKRRSSKSAAIHFGYVGEGLRLLLSWAGALILGAGSFLAMAGRFIWEVFRGERARQPFGLLLAAASLFTFVALWSYRAGSPEANLCGTLGYRVAGLLLHWVGISAFLATLFGFFWGIVRAFREESSGSAAGKLIGVLGLVAAVSLGVQALEPDRLPDRSFPTGLGGWLGREGHPPLLDALGPFGFTVLVIAAGLVALLLATEWAFVPLVRELLRKSGKALFQPELPLSGPGKKSGGVLGEARRNHERAAGWLRRGFGALLDLFRPFQTGKDEEAEEVVEEEPGAGEEEDWEGEEEDEEEEEGEYEEEEEEEEEDEEDEEEEEAASLPGIVGIRKDASRAPAPRRHHQRQPELECLPSIGILKGGETRDRSQLQAEIDALGQRLQAAFDAFGLNARVVGAERGPTLTLFEVKLASGVSVKKLKNQRDDLGVALGSHGVRIVYPLAGRSTVGVEVPNLKREIVHLRDVFEESDTDWEKVRLPVLLGRDTLGRPAAEDLTAMPHMLIAGTTGSGKSVCLNSILTTWLLTRTPDQLRLILIDPKQVELQLYCDIPHLLCPVVTDMRRAPYTLEWATRQMEDRLHMFRLAGVRSIGDYNKLGTKELQKRIGEDAYDPEEFPEKLPFVVMVIDELADLMLVSAKEVEVAVSRLAAKARAAGIHLVVATQRPSTDVVTGLIKMNLPTRIAFQVTSAVDSRVILDESGADSLLGNGDFLYRPPASSALVRGQGALVTEKEVREICEHLRKYGKPEYLEELVQMRGPGSGVPVVEDPLFEDAVRIILQSGRGSASLLQRALSIGYTRASRLIDIMGEQGILGPHTGSKAREVLLTLEQWEESRKQPQ